MIDIADKLGLFPPATLADAAEGEALARERKLAELIRDKRPLPEAQMEDWQAWLAIAAFVARRRITHSWSYQGMEAAARRAADHLRTLRRKRPDDTEIAGRLECVEAILHGIQRVGSFYADLTAEVRKRVAEERQAGVA